MKNFELFVEKLPPYLACRALFEVKCHFKRRGEKRGYFLKWCLSEAPEDIEDFTLQRKFPFVSASDGPHFWLGVSHFLFGDSQTYWLDLSIEERKRIARSIEHMSKLSADWAVWLPELAPFLDRAEQM